MTTKPMHRYDRLNPDKLADTLDQRARKVQEIFPKSGLSEVAENIGRVCKDAIEGSRRLARPNWLRRILSWLALVLVVLAAAALIDVAANTLLKTGRIEDLSQHGIVLPVSLASGLSSLPLMFFWLINWEQHWKRQQGLKELHRLRCLVHVVDMHQLAKDPGSATVTDASGKRPMTPGELVTYLDICTDLLSLAGKIAVLYAQNTHDQAVLEAVSDLEEITTNLSVKIWQKIGIVQSGKGGMVVPA